MTYEPQDPQGAFSSMPPTPPPPFAPTKKKHRGRNWTLGILGACVAAGIVGGVAAGSSKDSPGKPAVATSASTPTSAAPSPAAAATEDNSTNMASNPEPAYVTVNSHNIRVTIKILSKACFGSAGCNITYRPEVTQTVPAGSFDPTTTWDVTYEVRGGEDGAQVDTLEVTGDSFQGPDEQVIGTSSQGARLTAVITDIEAE